MGAVGSAYGKAHRAGLGANPRELVRRIVPGGSVMQSPDSSWTREFSPFFWIEFSLSAVAIGMAC
jgi:hypothetical protein